MATGSQSQWAREDKNLYDTSVFLFRSIIEVKHGIGVLSTPLKVIILTSGTYTYTNLANFLDERIWENHGLKQAIFFHPT